MRLFASVDLPDEFAAEVEAVQDEFADASGLSFTDPEQAHVTLKFLGDVNQGELPRVKNALRRAVGKAGVGPFEATYEGLGVFPDLGYIQVLWLGVGEGSEAMTSLHEAIEREVTRLGFDPEDHDFTPHVTLARMEHAGGKELVQENVEELDPTVGTTEVSEIRLTESVLTDDGPEYSTVESFELE
ncbi:RNA 2',3'-cyclic phosphodiesterase [Halorussus gelatinilyticus]|uniref:RNA 2',3'-cyclic phosphodiesterase n=1 Tax=Halorussus gelatinilyticus TaxID=2937524 RepID=A0A8U0ILW7_9EURY|nr:RNA 2',3'-cyclic phosphodiesterase [Halorussus gelatinilyticus]UPW01601.1 RNA 2',3'-cyclic phosphodiesterase [Halorussus gelatinilyticus]